MEARAKTKHTETRAVITKCEEREQTICCKATNKFLVSKKKTTKALSEELNELKGEFERACRVC